MSPTSPALADEFFTTEPPRNPYISVNIHTYIYIYKYIHICIDLGEGNGNPLQNSCLENPMVSTAWRATVHEIAESDRTEQLTHTHMYISVFFILILYSLYFTAGISMVFRSWFRGENQVGGEELSEAASWKWDNEDAVKQPQVSARSLYSHRTNGGLYLLICAAGQTCNPGMWTVHDPLAWKRQSFSHKLYADSDTAQEVEEQWGLEKQNRKQ